MTAPKKPAPKSQQAAAPAQEAEAAQPRAAGRREDGDQQRAPLNHAKVSEVEVGGMKFRRSRTGLDHSSKMTLDIPKEMLNADLEYRWVNDDGNGVQKRRERGYEIVDQASFAAGADIETTRRVGTKKDGSPLNAVLMATPKKWCDEGQQAKEEQRLKHERGAFTKDGDGKELGKEFYNKGSRIES
jgi:hypothetical protein